MGLNGLSSHGVVRCRPCRSLSFVARVNRLIRLAFLGDMRRVMSFVVVRYKKMSFSSGVTADEKPPCGHPNGITFWFMLALPGVAQKGCAAS